MTVRGCGAALAAALLIVIVLAPFPLGLRLAWAQAPRVASDSLTVEECIALARRQAPEVRALALSAEAARLDSIAVTFNRRPTFSFFGGTTIAPRGFYDPAATNLGDYELKAGAELPLRDGGARRRERMRGILAALSAAIESARATRDVSLRAAEVALGAQLAREQIESLTETIDWLERLELLVASGVRAGSRSRADAERVALEMDGARSELENQRLSESTFARELGNLTGRGLSLVVVRGSLGEEPLQFVPDSLTLRARSAEAPEVRAARVTEAVQLLALEDARNKNAFTVDLQADAGLWGTDLTHAVPADLAAVQPGATLADRIRRDLGASVSLRFRWPVFDPAVRYSTAARARDLRAAEVRTVAARLERERAAADAVARASASERRLAIADSSVVRAEEHLLRLRSLYADGASTLLELLDARSQLDDARSRRAGARMENHLARWQEVLQ